MLPRVLTNHVVLYSPSIRTGWHTSYMGCIECENYQWGSCENWNCANCLNVLPSNHALAASGTLLSNVRSLGQHNLNNSKEINYFQSAEYLKLCNQKS